MRSKNMLGEVEGGAMMKRIAFLLVAGATLAGAVAHTAPSSGHADGELIADRVRPKGGQNDRDPDPTTCLT